MPENDPAYDEEPNYIKVTCAEDGCNFSTHFREERGIRDGQWRCSKHKTREDRDCQYTGCSLPGIFTDKKLDGVGYCMHHRRYVMDGMRESRVDQLAKALGIAKNTLDFIIAQRCVCPKGMHLGSCAVMAAQRGLENIKIKLE